MRSLIHKELDYFDTFEAMAAHGREAATRLRDLLTGFADVEARVQAIKEVEHAADREVRKITQHLNGSFITPIDREDILQITKRLDQICDTANAAAQRLVMYNVKTITDDALQFAALLDAASLRLLDLISELRHVRKSRKIHDIIEDVNRIEREGDELYHDSMRRLFSGAVDSLEVIKWNETYQSLEKVIDACEDVANAVQRIAVKYN